MAIVIALIGVIAFQAAPASAQSQPPICEDYPDLDVCNEPGGGGGDNPDGDDGAGPGVGSGGSGDGDGSLPFTGYPLTGLILLLLALLALGLAIRGAVAIRERLARDPA